MCGTGTHIYLFNSIHGSQKRKNSKDKNNNHLFLKLVRVPSSVPVLLQYHLYYYTLLLSCIRIVLFLRYRYLRFLGFRTGSFVT